MSIISRYLLRLHSVPFLFALSALTSILLLNQVARRFPDLVGKGLPGTVIVEVFVLSVPFLIAMTLPMAVLVSVLYTMSRLTADNELTALRAGGVSIVSVSRTLLLASVGVAALAFLFSDQLLPRSNHRLRTLLTDITRTKPTFALEEQVINEVRRNSLFLRAGRVDPATYKLEDVTIFDLSDHNRKRVTYADSAYMAFDEAQEDLYLTLYDGTMHESDRADEDAFQMLSFRKDIVRVEGVAGNFTRTLNDQYKGDREMGVCEMDSVITRARGDRWIAEQRAEAVELNSLRGLVGLAPMALDTTPPAFAHPAYCRALSWAMERWGARDEDSVTAEVVTDPGDGDRAKAITLGDAPPDQGGPQSPRTLASLRDQMRDRALQREARREARDEALAGTAPVPRIATAKVLRDRARSGQIREANYLVELHKKYAIAAASIVFVLVAIPAAISVPKGGVGLVIGLSLAVFGVFYVGLIGGESLANKLIVPPFWAMWAPNIFFGIVGGLALWRISRKATTVRGGGPIDTVRRRLSALFRARSWAA